MVTDDCGRTYINMAIGKIKQMFRWGVSEELLDEAVLRWLQSVADTIQTSRSSAKLRSNRARLLFSLLSNQPDRSGKCC